MSLKWTNNHSDSGILRKSEFKEKKEELFVFGYSCKLFRDDEKAQHIDQGKHLIPWMGDETLKIDRYDARGALHDLGRHEAPPGGFDWRVEMTRAELDVEQLCDEERYRALHTNEDEEEMYKEEELKRLHAAGYGQVGFNYDTPADPTPEVPPSEVEEPFIPAPAFKALLPIDIVLPETEKQNVIIEKTAKFVALQGAQMEILIKAKQGDNPQFQFMNRDNVLHPYYTAFIALVKAGKWPEKQPEPVEEKPQENEEYLHPSLASTVIESAPSIPSIHYKPSADCDYTMLISKMRGEATLDESYTPELAPGEVPPPGTEPLPPRASAEISRGPVMYNRDTHSMTPQPAATQAQQAQYQQYAAYYHQYMAQTAAIQAAQAQDTVKRESRYIPPANSTGLSLMKNYNTDSGSDVSDCDDNSSTDSKDRPTTLKPPSDIQVVIDKMAAYVARNGDEFADIVRAKGDPRFTFLDPGNVYHPYYSNLVREKRGKQSSAPVSFSIKKLKEPDPILPKPALPYESSSEDESEKTEKTEDKETTIINVTTIPNVTATPFVTTAPNMTTTPPVVVPTVVYKMEGTLENNLPTVKTLETVKASKSIPDVPLVPEVIKAPVQKELPKPVAEKVVPKVEVTAPVLEKKVENHREKESPRKEKKKSSSSSNSRKEYHKEKKKDRNRNVERERKHNREAERESKRRKHNKEELENEIISLEDHSDEMIDLTGDQSDSKVDGDMEIDRHKQLERRRRAAEFLKKVGVDPAAAALPTTSLASAMVDTLESLRKKKAEEEEKRRKREKRRHRDRHGNEDGDKSHRKSKRRKYKSSDDEESDYDSSKKKKRKKDKKHNSKNKKKKKRETEVEVEEIDHPLPPNINLTTTLKELRTSSPTKVLVQDIEESQQSWKRDSSSDNEVKRKKKKENREYSEGEWSSDSEGDSVSTVSKEEN